jgi:glycosyltransferase involved in cell wall biosynthesis
MGRPVSTPIASVVIPALDAATTIGEQLESLAAQDVVDQLEVLVMDNGSTDATRAVASSWQPRIAGLRVVDASGKRGASNARNLGIEVAASDNVLLCDADDRVAPGWASEMLAQLAEADAVAGRVLPWELRDDPVPSEGFREWFEPRYDFLPAFTTNNAGVRKSAVTAVGGFDDRMDPAEDIDLAWRMQLAGRTFVLAPDAVVFARPRTTPRDVFRQTFAYGRSEVRLYSKFRGDGMPKRSVSSGVRKLASLARTSPDLIDAETRVHWFGRAGWRCGRIAGSAREHVLYL